MDLADDDWFFDSIQRYNKLQMYSMDETIHNLEFSDSNKICVSISKPGPVTRYQILEYALPVKYLDMSGSLCSTDHSLKIINGTYTDCHVLQMKVFKKSNRILTSEQSQSSITEYRLSSDDLGTIKKDEIFNCDFKEPYLANYSTSENILSLCKSTNEPVQILDWNTKRIIQNIILDEILNTQVKAIFKSPSELCTCLEKNGLVRFHDLRSDSKPFIMCTPQDNHTSSIYPTSWSISSLESSNIINLISSNGSIEMYDIRNLTKSIFHYEISTKNSFNSNHHSPIIETCSYDETIFSISGFNENIEIYKRLEENKCKKIFTNDSHKYVENCNQETIVLCHKWMPLPYKRMILSSADNNSIICIQYNIKS